MATKVYDTISQMSMRLPNKKLEWYQSTSNDTVFWQLHFQNTVCIVCIKVITQLK